MARRGLKQFWASAPADKTWDPLARSEFFDAAGRQTEFLCATLASGRLLVKTEDHHVGRALFVKGGRGDMKVLTRSVSTIRALCGDDAVAGRTFIDVGANIGSTTVSALISHPFADAVALEPEPENNLTLRLNLVLNGLDDRVRVLAAAASNKVGTVDLVVNRSRGGKHFISSRPGVIARLAHGAQVVKVPVVTLDSLSEQGAFDPDRVGLLWIDAENHEPEILEGAKALIGRGVPVLMEWDPKGLAVRGNPQKLDDLINEHYTHIAKMRADVREGHPRFELVPAASLRHWADEQQHFNDVLVLRLADDQVPTDCLSSVLRPSVSSVGAATRLRAARRRIGRWLKRRSSRTNVHG